MNLISLCKSLNKEDVLKTYRETKGLTDEEETRNSMFMPIFIEYFAQLIPEIPSAADFIKVNNTYAVGMHEDGTSFWLAIAKWEPIANLPIITDEKDPILIFLLVMDALTRFQFPKSFFEWYEQNYLE